MTCMLCMAHECALLLEKYYTIEIFAVGYCGQDWVSKFFSRPIVKSPGVVCHDEIPALWC